MFLARRPSAAAIGRFLEDSHRLPLWNTPIGIATRRPERGRLDEQLVTIGQGPADFERARAALVAWRQFDLGWVELFPQHASTHPGNVVAVLIRHLGFWSLNGARVVYPVPDSDGEPRFGYAYGTLSNHAEHGEELFEVFLNRANGDVVYRIRAVSWPQALAARLGYPFARVLQARFRRDSAAAMRMATAR